MHSPLILFEPTQTEKRIRFAASATLFQNLMLVEHDFCCGNRSMNSSHPVRHQVAAFGTLEAQRESSVDFSSAFVERRCSLPLKSNRYHKGFAALICNPYRRPVRAEWKSCQI